MSKVTFGADPEFFIARKENPSKAIPACGLFGGAKKAPIFVTPEGGYLEDGCAVEFNVTPADTLLEVRKRIDRLITAFLTLNKDYVILPHTTVAFDQKDLRNHPQASVLGCDADLWAYGLRVKPQINMFRSRRFAGGHIHIGIDPWPKDLDPKMFVKALDLFVYTYYLQTFSADPHRYAFYGHPGLYRETSYGIEWRSPDNSWALPREDKSEAERWEAGIRVMQNCILKLVADIDILGGEKFNAKFSDFISYMGGNALLKTKNSARTAEMYSRVVQYTASWNKSVSRN